MASERNDLARLGLRHPRLAVLGEAARGLVLVHPDGDRVVVDGALGRHWFCWGDWESIDALAGAGWMLDLGSLATAGVLLGAVDPIGMRGITVCRERDGTWWVDTYTGPTLAEAALAALLAIEPVEVPRGD